MQTIDATHETNPRQNRWSRFRSFLFWRNLFVALVIFSPVLIRTWCLSKVPTAAIPFDVEELCRIEIQPGQNAFDYFIEATRLKAAVEADYKAQQKVIPWADYDAVMANGWSEATDSLKQWLADHHDARQAWRRGTECSDALFVSPRDITFMTQLTAVQALRDFGRMAQCEGMRLEPEGHLLEAAEEYLAILRSGQLARRHSCVLQSLVGIAVYAVATERLVRWSEDSRVSASDLRTVLEKVKAANRDFEPPSTALKVEYLSTIHSLSQPGWCQGTDLTQKYQKFEPFASIGLEAYLWVLGEPELAHRTVTHVLANQLPEIDKTLAERSPTVKTPSTLIFQQRQEMAGNSLPSAAIERAVERSLVAKQLMVYSSQLDVAIGRNRCRRIGLELVLATQLYFREHGEFPADTSSLLPNYVDSWPVDPMQPTPGGLMQYERESTASARIRSIGSWGFDATLKLRTPESRQ